MKTRGCFFGDPRADTVTRSLTGNRSCSCLSDRMRGKVAIGSSTRIFHSVVIRRFSSGCKSDERTREDENHRKKEIARTGIKGEGLTRGTACAEPSSLMRVRATTRINARFQKP